MLDYDKHILAGVKTDHLFDFSPGLRNIAAGSGRQSAEVRFSVAMTRADRLEKSTLAYGPLGVRWDGQRRR